jgi:hypothetical protein
MWESLSPGLYHLFRLGGNQNFVRCPVMFRFTLQISDVLAEQELKSKYNTSENGSEDAHPLMTPN